MALQEQDRSSAHPHEFNHNDQTTLIVIDAFLQAAQQAQLERQYPNYWEDEDAVHLMSSFGQSIQRILPQGLPYEMPFSLLVLPFATTFNSASPTVLSALFDEAGSRAVIQGSVLAVSQVDRRVRQYWGLTIKTVAELLPNNGRECTLGQAIDTVKGIPSDAQTGMLRNFLRAFPQVDITTTGNIGQGTYLRQPRAESTLSLLAQAVYQLRDTGDPGLLEFATRIEDDMWGLSRRIALGDEQMTPTLYGIFHALGDAVKESQAAGYHDVLSFERLFGHFGKILGYGLPDGFPIDVLFMQVILTATAMPERLERAANFTIEQATFLKWHELPKIVKQVWTSMLADIQLMMVAAGFNHPITLGQAREFVVQRNIRIVSGQNFRFAFISPQEAVESSIDPA